ncbi:RNA methylase [Nitzschia inconspicua]|uniref:RNA methylase n=1 Tax=Nitzschia inconspicua TaxID=303405 RepID=A0A9K3KR70_9STRA|nr:RNA methylase [Nitzschia inconspicua]
MIVMNDPYQIYYFDAVRGPSSSSTINSSATLQILRLFSSTDDDDDDAPVTKSSQQTVAPLSSRTQPIRIFYASQGGKAKLFAQELQQTLQDELHTVTSVSCQSCNDAQLQPGSALHLFLTSTTGVGQPPDNAKEFYERIMAMINSSSSSASSSRPLSKLEYAVFGLGNSEAHPQHFNAMAKSLDARLSELGASRVMELRLGDDGRTNDVTDDFEQYMEDLLDLLKEDHSPAEAELSIADVQIAKSTSTKTSENRVDGDKSTASILKFSKTLLQKLLPTPMPLPSNNLVFTSTNTFSFQQHPYTTQQRFLTTTLRRRRAKYEKFNEAQLQSQTAPSSAIEVPFEYSGESLEEYRKKANLSPWTPVPDSVARKIFDSATPGPEDIHVELGSGDGRVNFHAMDYGVKQSIGIDVDPDIVAKANDRLQRIHPQPNMQFIVENLMDPKSLAWSEHVPNATILTMYFAKDGLEKIRPMLEQALRGKSCKIYTCGYAMPGWESQIVETVLDMPIYFYDWGSADVHLVRPDSFIDALPPGMSPPSNRDQYMHKKKHSTYQPDPLPGFHPDDLKDYAWDDFDSPSDENRSNDNRK